MRFAGKKTEEVKELSEEEKLVEFKKEIWKESDSVDYDEVL